MAVRRRFILAALGIVLLCGAAFGGARSVLGSDVLASDHVHVAAPVDAVTADQDGTAPCVLRADCGGASVLASVSVLLAVLVAMPTVGLGLSATPLGTAPDLLSSRLERGRLFRPPRRS